MCPQMENSQSDDGMSRRPMGDMWASDHALMALAESAADRAAKTAVKETFFVLGIDLGDETHVRATREAMTEMRDRWHLKKERSADVRRSVLQILSGVVIAIFASLTTIVASGNFKFHVPPFGGG